MSWFRNILDDEAIEFVKRASASLPGPQPPAHQTLDRLPWWVRLAPCLDQLMLPVIFAATVAAAIAVSASWPAPPASPPLRLTVVGAAFGVIVLVTHLVHRAWRRAMLLYLRDMIVKEMRRSEQSPPVSDSAER